MSEIPLRKDINNILFWIMLVFFIGLVVTAYFISTEDKMCDVTEKDYLKCVRFCDSKASQVDNVSTNSTQQPEVILTEHGNVMTKKYFKCQCKDYENNTVSELFEKEECP